MSENTTEQESAEGLHGKYEVYEDGERVEDCFVLEPEDDEAARQAMASYADAIDNTQLAVDLAEWLTEIAPSERRYGLGPDTRPIDDITAVDECDSCGWSPAAVILTEGSWECYNCGFDPDTDDELMTDGGRPPFIDPQTESVECYLCGQHIEDMSRVEGMDISEPDEYYPKMVPVCPTHGGEDSE